MTAQKWFSFFSHHTLRWWIPPTLSSPSCLCDIDWKHCFFLWAMKRVSGGGGVFTLVSPSIWPSFLANKLAAEQARISSNGQDLFVGFCLAPNQLVYYSVFLFLWSVGLSSLPQCPAHISSRLSFCSVSISVSPTPHFVSHLLLKLLFFSPLLLSDAISRASVSHGTKVRMIAGQRITSVSVVDLHSTEKNCTYLVRRNLKLQGER